MGPVGMARRSIAQQKGEGFFPSRDVRPCVGFVEEGRVAWMTLAERSSRGSDDLHRLVLYMRFVCSCGAGAANVVLGLATLFRLWTEVEVVEEIISVVIHSAAWT